MSVAVSILVSVTGVITITIVVTTLTIAAVSVVASIAAISVVASISPVCVVASVSTVVLPRGGHSRTSNQQQDEDHTARHGDVLVVCGR